MQTLKPYFVENSVPIVFCVDENYVKYLVVVIKSLIENSNIISNYEIYILTEGLSIVSQKNLENLTNNHGNIYINIINVKEMIENLGRELFFESRHIKISAYYRLFIPEIFKNFSKIIYLDSDVIVLADIAELYNQDIENYPLGIIEDFPLLVVKEDHKKWYIKRSKYNLEVLGISEDTKYFNSGVILFNISKIKDHFLGSAISILKKIKNPRHHDQDILNCLYAKTAKYLDFNWNIQMIHSEHMDNAPEFKKNYQKALSNPKVMHYISPFKPWKVPFLDEAQYFWKYARLTPYYETILIKINAELNPYNLLVTQITYNFYKILVLLTLGDKKVIMKKNNLRTRISEIKLFLKGAKPLI